MKWLTQTVLSLEVVACLAAAVNGGKSEAVGWFWGGFLLSCLMVYNDWLID